jgi:hypothetical protein
LELRVHSSDGSSVPAADETGSEQMPKLPNTERAAIKGRIEGWFRDGTATARAQSGMEDESLGTIRQRLSEAVDKPAGVLSGHAVQDFAMAFRDGAESYGRKGNPYREGEAVGAGPFDSTGSLADMAKRIPGSSADESARELERGLILRDFADGKFGHGLVAVVELHQGSDGHLLEAKLLEPSGSAAFDAHVLRVAPRALALLGPSGAKDKVLDSKSGRRSHWAFEGHVVYQRSLRDVNLLKDGWYLAALSGALAATGAHGVGMGTDGTYLDLRYPELKVNAKLLRIYE